MLATSVADRSIVLCAVCCVWLHNLKYQTDLIMDVPKATTTSTTLTLTESERRTNVLLVELDRPPIPHI